MPCLRTALYPKTARRRGGHPESTSKPPGHGQYAFCQVLSDSGQQPERCSSKYCSFKGIPENCQNAWQNSFPKVLTRFKESGSPAAQSRPEEAGIGAKPQREPTPARILCKYQDGNMHRPTAEAVSNVRTPQHVPRSLRTNLSQNPMYTS